MKVYLKICSWACHFWQFNQLFIYVKVEVEITNTDGQHVKNGDAKAYWPATVLKLMGYEALLRFEGFGDDDCQDFWINIATGDVHPIGWCAAKNKPFIPHRAIRVCSIFKIKN